MKIFVEIRFETSLKQTRERDQGLFGSAEEVTKRYELGYLPGQKIYLETCQPREKTDLVLDNNDLMNIRLFFRNREIESGLGSLANTRFLH